MLYMLNQFFLYLLCHEFMDYSCILWKGKLYIVVLTICFYVANGIIDVLISDFCWREAIFLYLKLLII